MARVFHSVLKPRLVMPSFFTTGTLLGLVVALSALTLGCGGDPPGDAPEKVVFMAGFKPQANLPFVAAYVAQEKGYFREQGLDVEIRHAPTGGHLQLLLSGDVDFTTAAATSVLKRRADPEIKVVAFVLFGQLGQQAYIALEESGIKTLEDWEGKTFGYKISVPPDYLAMLKTSGVDRSKITEVNAGFDPRVLTEGKVDILAVFKSNEPNIIRNLPGGGFGVTVWDPAQHGVPTLGLTYITRQDVADARPELVEKFLKATLKGVEFVLDEGNMEETLDIILKFASDENREHQRFMLEVELRDAVGPVTDRNGVGWMTSEQWQALYDHLIEFEALPGPYDFRTAFTDEFLRAVYDGNRLRWP